MVSSANLMIFAGAGGKGTIVGTYGECFAIVTDELSDTSVLSLGRLRL